MRAPKPTKTLAISAIDRKSSASCMPGHLGASAGSIGAAKPGPRGAGWREANDLSRWRRLIDRRPSPSAGPELRFELLNEPSAKENQQLNPFNTRMLSAIRESNPTRVVYITSNRYGSFDTTRDLDVPDDPNVAITLHYYLPFVFTHQRASWARFPADMPAVPFPGK